MKVSLPEFVKIVEVGPRDGLQNEPDIVPIEVRVALIKRLVDAGVRVIEAGSFVSPKWVPQMAGTEQVLAAISKIRDVRFPVLVPNEKGMELALNAGVKEISVFTAVSESFTKKNINCSIDESIARFEPIVMQAKQHGIAVRGYISCVWGCPFEGDVALAKTIEVAERLYGLGCYELSLGDTIGVGTPGKTIEAIEAVTKVIPIHALAVHFHNTYGQAIANIYAALTLGISVVDSSIAGLGGCPYAKGASGNVATEDVLYLLNGLGIRTGVDLKKALLAGQYIMEYLKRPSVSNVAKAMISKA